MNKLLRICCLSVCLSFSISNDVNAGQTATKACLNTQCDQFELHVTFSSDTDRGLTGAFGIIATLPDPRFKAGNTAFWTIERGWIPLVEGALIQPTEQSLFPLPATRDYVIFRGSNEDLCKISNGHGFNLFAWHAGLKAYQVRTYQSFLNKYEIAGWQADNFMYSVLFYEANKQKNVGKVYSHNCTKT